MELFLLNNGIKPNFYESEYNKYWEDAMFPNPELEEFKPDIIFIHTSNKNILNYPKLVNTKEEVDQVLENEYKRFVSMWETLSSKYHCPIIQNNFDYPIYRLLGNKDATDIHGRVNFITRLNLKFAEYAEEHQSFYINDLNYQSAQYGLDNWADPFYWYMYKYAVAVPAIPVFAYQVASIIKAIFGKNKKGFVLDLDNTLWGGIVGDDGVDNLMIGEETADAEAYTDFQKYLKEHQEMGIILNVDSKNEEENAIAGLNHVDGVLRPDDFIVIKANWDPKSKNFKEIAHTLNLGEDSLVFVDDNPAEREIINQDLPMVSTPAMNEVYRYIQTIDHSNFFEVISISKDDLKKNEMYKENAQRTELLESFDNYDDYLKSLDMTAEIEEFKPIYMARIAQLTNKSNQFNLTTKRYTQAEIEETNSDGVVSVVIGSINKQRLDIDLWIMSCRVLKRDMEYAMMDELVARCKEKGIKEIIGHYYPTAKNGMVKDFYALQGFEKIDEDKEGNTTWKYEIKGRYKKKNKFIKIGEIK
jgi:FkbH-like protein